MYRIAALGLAWLAVLSCALAADSLSVDAVEIVEYGTYRVERSGENISMATTATGRMRPLLRAGLVSETDRVPATVGTSFGCHFIIRGEPAGAPVQVTVVVEHPPLTKPGGVKTGTRDEIPWVYRMGKKVGYAYTFDYQWETVPGTWSIQVWWNGEKLAGQDFVVEKRLK